MSMKNVRSALVEAYLDAGLNLPTAYENMEADPPDVPVWVELTIIPTIPEAVTLGNGGEDEYEGIMQLDLHAPLNDGESNLLDVIDTLRNHFTAGRRFVYLGQEVLITNCGYTAPIISSKFFRIPASVIWTSRLTRAIN